jgi:hypothetical protein
MRRLTYILSAALASSLLVISFIAAAGVGIVGTYLGIKGIVDGDIGRGIVVLLLTTPALMLTQTAIGILAAPLGLLAERLEAE